MGLYVRKRFQRGSLFFQPGDDTAKCAIYEKEGQMIKAPVLRKVTNTFLIFIHLMVCDVLF